MYENNDPLEFAFSRFRSNRLESLKSLTGGLERGEEMEVLQSLSLLSVELAALEEEVLEVFPLEDLSSALIACLDCSGLGEILVLSMTCMSSLISLAPSMSNSLISRGVIGELISKIQNVDFVDVSECAISTLEKLSFTNALAIAQDPSFGLLVSVFDFFEKPSQKSIMSILVNITKALPSMHTYKACVLPHIPGILTLLTQGWTDTLSSILDFFDALLLAFARLCSGEVLQIEIEYLSSLGLMKKITHISDLSLYAKVCKLLSFMCQYSSSVCIVFFSVQGITVLKNGLSDLPRISSAAVDTLRIIQAVLPAQPHDPKQEIFTEHPSYVEVIGNYILPNIEAILEQRSLHFLTASILHKLVLISPSSLILTHINSLASALLELLRAEDLITVIMCLKTIISLHNILGDHNISILAREGVIDKVNQLDFKKFSKYEKPTDSLYIQILEESCNNSTKRQSVVTEIKSLKKRILNFKIEKKGNIELARNLANRLSKDGSVEDLASIITILTPYEFTQSGLANSIWDYLAVNSDPSQRVKKQWSLIRALGNDLDKVSSLLIKSAHHVKNFNVQCNKPFAHPFIKAKLIYCPSELKPEGLHCLFCALKTFSVQLQSDCTFEELSAQILKVRSKEDVKNMRIRFKRGCCGSFIDFQQLIEGNAMESPSMEIRFSVDGQAVANSAKISDVIITEKVNIRFWFSYPVENSQYISSQEGLISYILESSREVGLETFDSAYPYLRLLKFFNKVHSDLKYLTKKRSFPPSIFLSPKLSSCTTKNHRLNSLPNHCSFLFPLSSRVEFFDSFHVSERQRSSTRGKIKIKRGSILESAMLIFTDISLLKRVTLEFEFRGEIGTGLGPSLEFYHLLGTEIRKLRLWRPDQQNGLFPLPLSETGSSVLSTFTVIGTIVAKALIDKRPIDLPFNPAWWKLVLRQPLTVKDTVSILGKSLLELEEIAGNNHKFKGCDIADLGLTFTLIGFDNTPLKPKGEFTGVNSENLHEFVHLNAEMTLMQCAQALAFRQGIELLFPIERLEVFQPTEIESLLCGEENPAWGLDELRENVVSDHGYDHSSHAFQNLLLAMAGFDYEERRKFMQFVTGSPRLPAGGFAKLNPKLTVVRKEGKTDGVLPSVMTCQNYLKLPEYSSLEILEEKLRYAINEGVQSFHLS